MELVSSLELSKIHNTTNICFPYIIAIPFKWVSLNPVLTEILIKKLFNSKKQKLIIFFHSIYFNIDLWKIDQIISAK